MINMGKNSVIGINVDAVDYAYAVDRIIASAKNRTGMAVTALAVHGVMTGYLDPEHGNRLNGFDLVTPDGQPVRWALRWLHGITLPDRVYGPTLTLKVLEAAEKDGLSVYFYGSTSQTLDALTKNIHAMYPALTIAGAEASKFRPLTCQEKNELIRKIKNSGASIVFVGLGCPRQEKWVHEYRDYLPMPLLAVGAAFDFHAGTLSQAPSWMQKYGLEWLYRLIKEPCRLWKRYILLNPFYLWLVLLQCTGFRKFGTDRQ
ncbi:MAG: glycosyltransferase [Bacteroidia bacterium]|nr:glycosyltransferase [Bacteroidia bacterium]